MKLNQLQLLKAQVLAEFGECPKALPLELSCSLGQDAIDDDGKLAELVLVHLTLRTLKLLLHL